MSTAVTTFTFDSNGQGWGSSWTGSDGSDLAGVSAPGSMILGAGGSALPSSANTFSVLQYGFSPNKTWEDLGVPHGEIVSGISVRYRIKKTSDTGPAASAYASFQAYHKTGITAFPLASLGAYDLLAADGAWHTATGGIDGNVDADFGASDQLIELVLTVYGSNGSFTWGVDTLIDTIEITVYYGPHDLYTAIAITPTSANLQVGQSTTFETNIPGDWLLSPTLDPDPDGPTHDGSDGTLQSDGGSISNSAGSVAVAAGRQSGAFVAPMVPGTYYLYVWDHEDG